jgi:hypothetical protein
MRVLVADAALPLIFFTLSAVILMLVPVILLEGVLLRIWLPTSTWKALKVSAVSNAISTLASVPLASPPALFLVSGQFARGLSTYSRESTGRVRLVRVDGNPPFRLYQRLCRICRRGALVFPAALLTILVPGVPDFLADRMPDRQKKDRQRFTKVSEKASPAAIKRAVRKANFVSYGLLYAVIAVRLVHSQF